MRPEVRRKEFKLETCNTCSACVVIKTGQILCRIHMGNFLVYVVCNVFHPLKLRYILDKLFKYRSHFRGRGYIIDCEQF